MKSKHEFRSEGGPGRGRTSTVVAAVIGGAACVVPDAAWAATPEEPVTPTMVEAQAAPASKATEKPRDETARVDLGLSLSPLGGLGAGVGALGSGAAGGLGGLGGLLPSVEATFELHLTGPLWGLARLSGSYDAIGTADGERGNAWGVAGDVGLRLEPRLFHWLDAGGHFTIGARWAESDANGWHIASGTLRGLAGVGAHFRATDFFGVRLSLDVLSASHSYTVGPGDGVAATSIAFTAAPRAELTFTF